MRFNLPFSLTAAALSALSIAVIPNAAQSSDNSATLSRLILRNHEVAISTKSGVTQYDVYAEDGQLLHADLTAEQLQASYPDLYNGLRPAIAREDGDTGPLMMLLDNIDRSH